MRHRRITSHFGRKSGPRVALIRGLVDSLVKYERIRTTLPKAKELRRHVEKAITRGKDATLTDNRVLMSKYPNKDTVHKIVSDLSPRMKDRPGGYTRIIKLGNRPGDNAEMAFIEFVDYDFEKAEAARKENVKVKVRAPGEGKSGGKLVEKEMTPEQYQDYQESQAMRKAAADKKKKRKIAEASRKTNWKKTKLKPAAQKAKKSAKKKK